MDGKGGKLPEGVAKDGEGPGYQEQAREGLEEWIRFGGNSESIGRVSSTRNGPALGQAAQEEIWVSCRSLTEACRL